MYVTVASVTIDADLSSAFALPINTKCSSVDLHCKCMVLLERHYSVTSGKQSSK